MKNSTLNQILTDYLNGYSEIVFALLFGSQVTGKTRFNSDIDIAIYFKDEPDILMMGQIIAQLESLTNQRIDLVILNALPFKNPLLAYNITGNHELLVCRDVQQYETFKFRSYCEYFDFEPILKAQNDKLIEELQDGNFGKTKTA